MNVDVALLSSCRIEYIQIVTALLKFLKKKAPFPVGIGIKVQVKLLQGSSGTIYKIDYLLSPQQMLLCIQGYLYPVVYLIRENSNRRGPEKPQAHSDNYNCLSIDHIESSPSQHGNFYNTSSVSWNFSSQSKCNFEIRITTVSKPLVISAELTHFFESPLPPPFPKGGTKIWVTISFGKRRKSKSSP
jgi:hypothetical protein